jgi:predicted ATP-grasp superfamily ATP-dependent carboligase
MSHLRWSARPRLQRPVLIAAFEGWNDAGDAATSAARFLRDRWNADHVGTIDPEEFFDFTSTRPEVNLDENEEREIVWPAIDLYAADGDVQAVVLVGIEPQLKWRTFCDEIVGVATELDARLVLTLGALLAEVPHTRPTNVIGTAVDPGLIARLGLRKSTYEGPTGIVGVLHDRCRTAGVESASLWAAVPAYVPGAPSPKAALALVERAADLLSVPIVTTDLEIASAAYERQVTEVVEGDEEMTEYVEQLEARYNEEQDVPSPEGLVEEVERFLRDQHRD